MRRRLLSEVDDAIAPMKQFLDPERAFPMSAFPDYEPSPDTSIAARARAENRAPMDVFYDVLMEDEGRALVLRPLLNYTNFSLDAVRTMLEHPTSAWGLGDGGAHCGTTCDASTPTFMLTHWSRDRDHDRLPLEWVVRKMTAETSALYGFEDRGTLTPGRLGDLNLIDYDGLALPRPEMVDDLPGGRAPVRAGLAGLRRHREAGRADPAQRRGSGRAARSTRAERIPEQVARAAPECGRGIAAVVERARTQREASATDARGQLVAQALEHRDLVVEPWSPRAGQSLPVGAVRCPLVGKRRERLADLLEGEADALGDAHEGDRAQRVAVEAPLPAVRPFGADQVLTLVVAQRRRGHPGPFRDFADGQQRFGHAAHA